MTSLVLLIWNERLATQSTHRLLNIGVNVFGERRLEAEAATGELIEVTKTSNRSQFVFCLHVLITSNSVDCIQVRIRSIFLSVLSCVLELLQVRSKDVSLLSDVVFSFGRLLLENSDEFRAFFLEVVFA